MTKPNDYPLEDCAAAAERILAKIPTAEIYQKWTCDHCGSRQTMGEKNVFFTSGTCEECKKVTDIAAKGCNYLVYGPGEVLAHLLGGDDA